MASRNAETEIFITLKILGKLKTHERLCTKGGMGIRIESNDKMQCIRRWYNGETRTHNISSVGLILDAVSCQIELRKDKPTLSESDHVFLLRLKVGLESARTGLLNMIQTYGNCPVSTARIEHFVESVDCYFDCIKKIINKNDDA